MQARPNEHLGNAIDYHEQLTGALHAVGVAFRAVGLQDCMDDWDCLSGHGSYARNLLQLTRNPSPEAVTRLLVQDAREPAFFDNMRRDIYQFAEQLLHETMPKVGSFLSPPASDLQQTRGKTGCEDTKASKPTSCTKAIRDKKLETRDKWIYQKCFKGVAYKKILAELERVGPEKGWPRISSIQGIRSAGLNYAKRHGCPTPPNRQAR